MSTQPVRKFAVSIDPEEIIDFEEPLSYFEETFGILGFEQVSSYKFRYKDRECTINAELQSSRDGFELWVIVAAQDEHEFRISDVADMFGGYLIAASAKSNNQHSTGFKSTTQRI